MRRFVLALLITGTVYADDIMVQRLQSVVDEVTELRSSYESLKKENREYIKQLEEKDSTIKKLSHNEGFDYKDFENSRREVEKTRIKNDTLLKEAQELRKKNLSLVQELEKEKSKKNMNSVAQSDVSSVKQAEAVRETNVSSVKQAEAVRETNITLVKEAETVRKTNLSLVKEIESLKKENTRLKDSANILAEKNENLLLQVSKKKSINSEIEVLVTEKIRTEELLKVIKEENKSLTDEAAEVREKNISLIYYNKKLLSESKNSKNSASDCSAIEEKNSVLEKELTLLSQKKCENRVIIEKCSDDNVFPKLKMKDEKLIEPKESDADHEVEVKKTPQKQETVLDKAISYRLIKEAAIYCAPDAEVIEIWEEKTSFTSNIYQGQWIKITGFFVNRKWRKAEKDMWVNNNYALKR